jgi:hypothetical protein
MTPIRDSRQTSFRSLSTKLVLCLPLLWGTAAWAQGFDLSHASFSNLLGTHVENGRVDYAKLKANRRELDTYLAELARMERPTFKALPESDRLAFLINLYNAATLHLIIDHYPVKSIKDIGSFFKGPWKQKVVPLLGKTITLNDLEHEIIRKQYHEPRIHVALVCAARGCPPLRSEAYVGARLGEQLSDQMRLFLANRAKNRIVSRTGKIFLSKIFKWYGADFKKSGNTLLGSLAPYWPDPAANQYTTRREWSIVYTDYDWSLNE